MHHQEGVDQQEYQQSKVRKQSRLAQKCRLVGTGEPIKCLAQLTTQRDRESPDADEYQGSSDDKVGELGNSIVFEEADIPATGIND